MLDMAATVIISWRVPKVNYRVAIKTTPKKHLTQRPKAFNREGRKGRKVNKQLSLKTEIQKMQNL